MPSQELTALTITAASIGFLHTLLGPDHYLPFIVLARARKWSLSKTGIITILCGIGHIASSVLLGLVGIAFGLAVARLDVVESVRGSIAAWALIAFGLVYTAWGIRHAVKDRPHTHFHFHEENTIHSHHHVHAQEHVHIHDRMEKPNVTPWILFTIFVLGPCEPLIPVLMYPAARESWPGLFWITTVFGTVTVLTMLATVMLLSLGVKRVPLGRVNRYAHAMAGLTLLLCGAAIQFLGL